MNFELQVINYRSNNYRSNKKPHCFVALFFYYFMFFSLLATICPPLSFSETFTETRNISAIKNFREIANSFLQGKYNDAVKSSWQLRKDFFYSRYVSEAEYLAGLSYLKLGRYKEARAIFKKLCHSSQNKDKFYLGLANSYYLEENWDKATSIFQEALRIFPQSTLKGVIYFKLGKCNQKKGEWETAKYYFSKLVQKFPQSLEAKQAKEILEKGEFYFTLQIAAFASKDNVKKAKYQLIREGYPAYISVIEKELGKFYRLRVGRFDLRQEAEAVKKNLEKDGYSPKIYP